jgi:rhomboid protease GluP
MDEIRDFLRSRSVANLTIVIINVAVFLILSCFGDTENADFMAAHGASYTPYIVQDGKYYLAFKGTSDNSHPMVKSIKFMKG